jgi:hypothetical protein
MSATLRGIDFPEILKEEKTNAIPQCNNLS